MVGSELSSGIRTGQQLDIRWDDGDMDLAELIVTTVIRDAMLAAFSFRAW